MEKGQTFPLIVMSRLRMATDGQGITTLLIGRGCSLQCQYCPNGFTWETECRYTNVSAQQLYNLVKQDSLYFQATGGGITFGGGEPLLHAAFIREFYALCRDKWRISVETSLNCSERNQRIAMECVDEFIVDIKDMNPEIYSRYTSMKNDRVIEGLNLLLKVLGPERVLVRVPHIRGFNSPEDVARSIEQLRSLGIERINEFYYICP